MQPDETAPAETEPEPPVAPEPPVEPEASVEPEATREFPPVAPAPAPVDAGASRQTLGILSLIFGVVGLLASAVAAGLVFGVAAAILGHQSLRREPAARAMAIAGLITGYAGIAISVVWGIILLATVLIPLFAVGLFVGTGSFGP